MLKFRYIKNTDTGQEFIETSLTGKPLLTTPQLNKGTAFSEQERYDFELLGKLPNQIETLEEQARRAYKQYNAYESLLKQNIYLNNLHDKNQTLFYRLVSDHLTEMLPTIYTPIVGTAVKQFSHEFRQPRGLYITINDQDRIEEILDNRSNPEIDLIVLTDGERVLGIGDQGIGGMDIPVAKLMVYTLCGGVNPVRTLPIFLDVGTNNETLLDDPFYLGLRHKRITGKRYDDFIEKFVRAVLNKFPTVFLHWEDFGRHNARKILEHYKNTCCTFNDDIQGTAAVTLAAILSALSAINQNLVDQRIVIFGAGSAGIGICDQICDAMVDTGLTLAQARQRFWLIDIQGLLQANQNQLTAEQKPYAKNPDDIQHWNLSNSPTATLLDTVRNCKPTILIGCAAVAGAFTEEVIRAMAEHTQRPIILPLSNPTEQSEAAPQDLYKWTNGKALVATGSPFDPFDYEGETIEIAQCNNALVFPGIGLGVITVKASRLTVGMIRAACETLTKHSPITQRTSLHLLPMMGEAKRIAIDIAYSVADKAIEENVATRQPQDLRKEIDANFWVAKYLPYKKVDINA